MSSAKTPNSVMFGSLTPLQNKLPFYASQLASIALIKCNGLDRPRVSEKDVRFRRVVWGETSPTRINNNDNAIMGCQN